MENIELENLKKKIDDLMDVKLKNGGGRKISMQRDVFEQFVYDRITLKGLSSKIITIFGIMLTILQIINIILNLKK